MKKKYCEICGAEVQPEENGYDHDTGEKVYWYPQICDKKDCAHGEHKIVRYGFLWRNEKCKICGNIWSEF